MPWVTLDGVLAEAGDDDLALRASSPKPGIAVMPFPNGRVARVTMADKSAVHSRPHHKVGRRSSAVPPVYPQLALAPPRLRRLRLA
jgi:hypothetical protein